MPPRVTFGLALPPLAPIHTQITLGILAEKLGFDNLWLPDHLLFPEPSPAPDPWTIMAAVAARTRRIKLGPAVTDPHRVHPAVFAQRLVTLDQLSRGRVEVGLGSGEAMNLEAFGIPWNRRVGRLKEFLTVVRGLIDSREPLTFRGDFFRLERARLSVHPYRGRHIRFHLAALGPTTQRLAGRWADGWFPVAIPASCYADYFEPMAEAVRKAGRDPDQIERIATVPVALDLTGELTEERLERVARPFGQTLVWPPVMRRMGFRFEPPEELKVDYQTVNPCDPESLRLFNELQDWIPTRMLLAPVVWGPVETVVRSLQEFVAQGVTHFYLINASPRPLDAMVALATRVLPRISGRPPRLAARVADLVVPALEKTGLLHRLLRAPAYRKS